MSNDPQNSFPRLVVVGSSRKKPRKPSTGLRWWGPKRPTQTSHFPSQVIRMAVMPTLSRNLWSLGLVWIWNLLRSYFVNPRPGGAVVLSFPHSGFVSKKASGSVRWNRDCGVAPQEGGRA